MPFRRIRGDLSAETVGNPNEAEALGIAKDDQAVRRVAKQFGRRRRSRQVDTLGDPEVCDPTDWDFLESSAKRKRVDACTRYSTQKILDQAVGRGAVDAKRFKPRLVRSPVDLARREMMITFQRLTKTDIFETVDEIILPARLGRR